MSRFRKIRVGFWVSEPAKWDCGRLYQKLNNDNHFEPFILLSYFSKPQENIEPTVFYSNSELFFLNQGTKVFKTFNAEEYSFKDLREFKPDIIFYQQPWQINKHQRPERNHKNALLCYVPYCFYSMNSRINYLEHFHFIMWKYFVETGFHKNEYKKRYNAFNCVVTGSVKLDEYKYINKNNIENYWKTKEKKRIIYAPHHSFNDGLHELATFEKNGKFILELAKSHPETEWIFRPHPAFEERVIKNSIMTKKELEEYYNEWKNIGSISNGGNYYEMFLSSDLLITDSISFLTEYAPTLKPVIHLRKNNQKEEFNDFVKKLDETYYQAYSNEELADIFNRFLNNDDYLKTARENNKNLLPLEKSACDNIFNYLKKSLRV